MANNQRQYQPIRGSVARGLVFLHSRVVLGTGGAITSQDSSKDSGMTLVKTGSEVGRYTVTLDKNYNRLLSARGTVIGADDTAYTTANGIATFIRDDDVGRGAADGTFELQFYRTDTGADAEVENSRDILVEVVVRDANLTGG